MLNFNLPLKFYRFYIQMFLTTIAWWEDLKYCLIINRLFQHWGSKFYVTQVDISDNCVIKYCWIINISTECLKWHLLLWQMQESMLRIHVCSIFHVLLATDTQMIQSSDWSKWRLVFWHDTNSRLLSGQMPFHVFWHTGSAYISYNQVEHGILLIY